MENSEKKIGLEVEVNNQSGSPVQDDFFLQVAKKTIQHSGYGFLRNKKISLSLALVAENEMQDLNSKYRKKNSVTDVLSFFEYENENELREVQEEDIFLGELIVCYDDIAKYAEKQGLVLEQELVNVVSHGVLHLLGFSHGEKMFTIQKKVINEIQYL